MVTDTLLPTRNAADVRDVDGPRWHLALRNEIAVDTDLHGRRECNLGPERRRRILDEIRVHRVELGQADPAQGNGAREVERRREEIAKSQAAQVRSIVILQIGQQPREPGSVTPLPH